MSEKAKKSSNNGKVDPERESNRREIIEAIIVLAEDREERIGFIGDIGERELYAEAIIGMTSYPEKFAVVYSYDKLVGAFMESLDGDYIGAVEWIEHNVTSGWPYGDEANKPIIIEELEDLIPDMH